MSKKSSNVDEFDKENLINKLFRNKIRLYNNIFAFTSFRGDARNRVPLGNLSENTQFLPNQTIQINSNLQPLQSETSAIHSNFTSQVQNGQVLNHQPLSVNSLNVHIFQIPVWSNTSYINNNLSSSHIQLTQPNAHHFISNPQNNQSSISIQRIIHPTYTEITNNTSEFVIPNNPNLNSNQDQSIPKVIDSFLETYGY
ncbi:unnamed protein product [Brachionus calyciflorus]|uniref:Uncharacterized protein n=1 Tax=Brachionus calyciflorus TaxID=104777 RepID=A0A814JJG4_9BILA|nr:unnamed protein product [Brachionus calyciflorus]